MNDLLVIAALVFAGLHQKEDRIAVLCFSVPLLIYGILDEFIPDDMGTLYLLGATWIDVAIIFYLSRLVRISELTVNIQKACESFIYINLFGWIAYMLYIPHEAYNNTCTIIYAWVLIKIIEGSGWRGLRDLAVGWRSDRFYSGHRTGGFVTAPNKEALRN